MLTGRSECNEHDELVNSEGNINFISKEYGNVKPLKSLSFKFRIMFTKEEF